MLLEIPWVYGVFMAFTITTSTIMIPHTQAWAIIFCISPCPVFSLWRYLLRCLGLLMFITPLQ